MSWSFTRTSPEYIALSAITMLHAATCTLRCSVPQICVITNSMGRVSTLPSFLNALPISFRLGVSVVTVTVCGSLNCSYAVRSCLLFSECAYSRQTSSASGTPSPCILVALLTFTCDMPSPNIMTLYCWL